MELKGHVVSYVADKKYGFVNGNDGESYFFHLTYLQNKGEEHRLVKNAPVSFVPSPTSKGLSAKSIEIHKSYPLQRKVDFFVTKSPEPRFGKVIHRESINSRFFKDRLEGEAHLKELAAEVGGNAILNMQSKRHTWSDGNYLFKMHSFECDFAFVTESTPIDDKDKSELTIESISNQVDSFREAFKKVLKIENEYREAQLNTGHRNSGAGCGWLIALALLFIVLAMNN